MHEITTLDADRRLAAALAVADGRFVDWPALEALARTPDDHVFLEELRAIALVPPLAAPAPAALHESILHPAHSPAALVHPDPVEWGPLTVIEKVGSGSFGDVYRAWDPRLDREVALKLLRRREDGMSADSVVQEGRLLARVHHPNVATVYGAARIADRTGVWMEFIHGETLEDELRRRGPFAAREIASIGDTLSSAVAAVHEAGLLHRDIKAQNVMRGTDGRLVLMDFGTGHEIVEPGLALAPAGTPLYVAPEVLAGENASRASDIYSLGVLLWHLTTAHFPVEGGSVDEIRRAHTSGLRGDLYKLRPDVPRRLVAALAKATAPAPDARYHSADELRRALSAVTASRRGLFAAVAVMIVLAVVGWTARGAWTESAVAPPASFVFGSQDYVLISRFENRTGDPQFDGGVEYAIERGLTRSGTVRVVPFSRIEDTLRMMQRPLDTIVDRTVGRDVAIRDGGIRALLAGRIEQLDARYVITAELIDPADDSTVGTATARAASVEEIPQALARQALALRRLLGETLNQIRESEPVLEAGTTRFLDALRLHNRSYELGRSGRWTTALEIARHTVAVDPNFASGWTWLAWTLRNAKQPVPEVRQAAARAKDLTSGVPEWERQWILGSYYMLHDDYARAVPAFEALVKLRPDHHYGLNNLTACLEIAGDSDALTSALIVLAQQRPNDVATNFRAAANIIQYRNDLRGATPYTDRVRQLLGGKRSTGQAAILGTDIWLALLPAYQAWKVRDIDEVTRQFEAAAKMLDPSDPASWNAPAAFALGHFALTLGKLQRSASFFGSGEQHPARAVWELAIPLARNDRRELARSLRVLGRFDERPSMFLRAGLVAEAEQILRSPRPARNPTSTLLLQIGSGQLALTRGNPEQAIAELQPAVYALAPRPNLGEYQAGCESLADAFRSQGQAHRVIPTLESCARRAPPFVVGGWFNTTSWMYLRMRLADEYRRAERQADALAIEDDLRNLLKGADADHPLVIRLKARSRTG